METIALENRPVRRIARGLLALGCSVLLLPGQGFVLAQSASAPKPAAPAAEAPKEAPKDAPKEAPKDASKEEPKIPADQLDSLVAPIALYPDPLLAQTLVASTYPLEIVQLQQWMAKNPNLKDKALADAVAKQPWDPSIQSMAATADVVKRLAEDIQWTTDLGNAFLAQQADVMDAVQRMRKKAKDNGALESNEQQKVETKTIEEKTVIVVESADPEVIYVPSYSPTVVYGPPVYPYPPIYYPPYYAGAAFVSFSFGVMMGAAFWGGSCCGCGWGGGNVNINVNNNFNRNNINNINRGGNNNWSHNPQHRGGTPYGDKATNNKYGGGNRASASNRAGTGAGNRGASASNRAGGTGSPSAGNRAVGGTGSPGASNRAVGGSGSASNRGTAGGDKIGNRSIPSSGSSSRAGGFGGSSGFSGSSARSSSSRGSRSMGGMRGGGGGGRRR
jgi:hypothetical protein